MVNAALASGVEKFCHVSSVAALGYLPKEILRKNALKIFLLRTPPILSVNIWLNNRFGGQMRRDLKVVVVSPSIILGAWSDYETEASACLRL